MADYDIAEAFAVIEDELIASMMRNMRRHKVEEADEEKQWAMWQAEQLKSLEKYRRQNQRKFGKQFTSINRKIEAVIRQARDEGEMDQELEILEAIRDGFKGYRKAPAGITAEFFKLNDRKLEALIQATISDMEKAETAILRMSNDQYRKVIFNAQVYANTGAGTYEKAVDMATKDMLDAGLNCVEYANGARHGLADYADMALRTAGKRAYLQGEGTKRQEWGIHTVIVNKRGNPCPLCLPFCGKVLIDDVWSGGSKSGISPETGKKYPLMSEAVKAGLYHPRCKDSHTTYFEFLDGEEPEETYTQEELDQITEEYKQDQKRQYAERQTKKFERLAKYSLDEENQKRYMMKKERWDMMKENNLVAKREDSDIIEMYRKGYTHRKKDLHGNQIIDKATYHKITNPAIKAGADIRIATEKTEKEILERLISQDATAVTYGDIIFFREDATISDVLEEVHHFYQNKQGLNAQYGQRQRIILNEIDAKKFLLSVQKKYNIPVHEVELTRRQLMSYTAEMQKLKERGEWDE